MKIKHLTLVLAIFAGLTAATAHADVTPVSADQASDIIQTVLTALESHDGMTCAVQGEVNQGADPIPLQNLIQYSRDVFSVTAPLPTYEFVFAFGSTGQNTTIVTLSQDKKSLLSATIISSIAENVHASFSEDSQEQSKTSAQLVPIVVRNCK